MTQPRFGKYVESPLSDISLDKEFPRHQRVVTYISCLRASIPELSWPPGLLTENVKNDGISGSIGEKVKSQGGSILRKNKKTVIAPKSLVFQLN